MTNFFGSLRLSVLCVVSVCVLGCSDSSDRQDPVEPPLVEPPEPELTYQAEIVWTEYGIPHVTADDWGSLGYGLGYAYASENYCTIMREYVNAAGESARYLGDEGDINADLVFGLLNDDERIQRLFDDFPDYIKDNLTGYAAGINRHLNETGVDNLAEGDEGCRGADWVREIDYMDATRLLHKAILRGSSGPLARFSTAVTAPQESVAAAQMALPQAQVEQLLAGMDERVFQAAMNMPEGWEIGSNAYAVGEEASQTGAGILFGNPHFPWQGSERFFVFKLTMGDEYNVMGAALAGIPAPVIAFNDNVAWSHTEIGRAHV